MSHPPQIFNLSPINFLTKTKKNQKEKKRKKKKHCIVDLVIDDWKKAKTDWIAETVPLFNVAYIIPSTSLCEFLELYHFVKSRICIFVKHKQLLNGLTKRKKKNICLDSQQLYHGCTLAFVLTCPSRISSFWMTNTCTVTIFYFLFVYILKHPF